MSDKATPRPKRKTWKDRRCHHRNPAQTRVIYDFIHCSEPNCWREVLAACGLQKIDKQREEAHQRAAEALRTLVEIVEKAGLIQLSRGVELGPTSWFVKASERMEFASYALAELDKAEGRS